jgi:hypothetical protein
LNDIEMSSGYNIGLVATVWLQWVLSMWYFDFLFGFPNKIYSLLDIDRDLDYST